jgi:ABC-type Fe3+ transport system permease subunit
MSEPTNPLQITPPGPRRRGLRHALGIFLWVAALGFVIGAIQVGLALHSGQAWMNYRGQLLTHDELRNSLVLFAAAGGLCTLLALRWQRFLRRDS